MIKRYEHVSQAHAVPRSNDLAAMTSQQQKEVESLAAFLIVQSRLQQPQCLTDDISVQELLELVAASGSFDWLKEEEEDIYSLADSEAVQWPSP